MKRQTRSLEDRIAGTFLVWVGVHILLGAMILTGGPAVIAVPALPAYGLCVFRMDRLLAGGGDGEHVRLLRNYWLTALAGMLLWLVWIQPALAGCGGVVGALALTIVIPYATNLSHELGWARELLPRSVCRVCQYALLAVCAGHAAYYLRLSRRSSGGVRKAAG